MADLRRVELGHSPGDHRHHDGGRELAERIGGTPNPSPVLCITGYGQEGFWLPGPVLPKPFQLDALNAEVNRLLAV